MLAFKLSHSVMKDHGFALRKPVEQLLELDVKDQKRGSLGNSGGKWKAEC